MGEVLLALLSDGELDGISTWDVEEPWLHGTCFHGRGLTCVDGRERAAVADSPPPNGAANVKGDGQQRFEGDSGPR